MKPYGFLFRYDTRGNNHEDGRHWSDDKTLGGRAFFRGDHFPGRLVLDNVKPSDRATYKCRVDFAKAPTRISSVKLDVMGNYYWKKKLSKVTEGDVTVYTQDHGSTLMEELVDQ